ncbi:hypothetical protein K501DRAFT_280329 [Backusella circina FSU 941]|nr:hypothetical protein K501DRAFT_280329 [Backusella circina FSU 941]
MKLFRRLKFDISPQTTYSTTDPRAKKKATETLEETAAPYIPLRACLGSWDAILLLRYYWKKVKVTKGSDSSLLFLHINPRKRTCDVAVQTESVPVTVGVQTIERSSTANSVEMSKSESSSDSEENLLTLCSQFYNRESDAGDDLNEQFKDTRTVLNKSIETEKKIREKRPSTSHKKNEVNCKGNKKEKHIGKAETCQSLIDIVLNDLPSKFNEQMEPIWIELWPSFLQLLFKIDIYTPNSKLEREPSAG